MISRAGLLCEVVTKNDDVIAKNEVIDQEIPAGCEIAPDTAITLTVSCGTWSNWTDIEPDASTNEVESKIEYRKRTRTKGMDHKKSSTPDIMDGYNLCDSKKVYSDWNVEDYFTNIPKKTSEVCEIVENLVGFKYCGWFYKGNNPLVRNSFCSLEAALYFNNDTNKDEWEYSEVISYSNVKETVISWTPLSDIPVMTTPAGDKVMSNIHMITYRVDGKDFPLKYGSFETQWYKYKMRNMDGIT